MKAEQKTRAELEAEVKELRDYVDELESKLDTIADVVGEEDPLDDEDDAGDGDDADEADEDGDGGDDCNDDHTPGH